MYSTAELVRAAKDVTWLDKRRSGIVTITVNGSLIDLRDQKPLYPGKMRLQGGWTFADLIRQLNDRIFFWPGGDDGPISSGVRHYQRYKGTAIVIMRVRTQHVLSTNRSAIPLFCKYNSGSPRPTGGKGSPRGPSTFVECHSAPYTPSKVVELTFANMIQLPRQIESSAGPFGPWTIH